MFAHAPRACDPSVERMTISWLPFIARCYNDFLGARNEWEFAIRPKERVYISRANPSLNYAIFRVNTPEGIFCCKLLLADQRQRALREWNALRILDQHSLDLAPLPFALDESRAVLPLPVIVMSWVQGRPLNHQRLTQSMLNELIYALQRVHSLTPKQTTFDLPPGWAQPHDFAGLSQSFEDRLQIYLTWQREANPFSVRASIQGLQDAKVQKQVESTVAQAVRLAELAARLPGIPMPTLVRTETTLADVMWTADEKICLLDWDASGWGDPAFDLAALRWHPQNQDLSLHQWEIMRAAYIPPPLDDAFSQRLRAWEAILPVDWCLRSLLVLVDAAQPWRSPGAPPLPESVARQIRLRFDRYLSTTQAILRVPFLI